MTRKQIKPYLEQVKGNTRCIVTGYARIPLYQLDKNRVVLIDSGLPDDGEELVQLLKENQMEVAAVLTSHTHPDHAGNHRLLQDTFGAQIYMTPLAKATMSDPMSMYAILGTKAGYHKSINRLGKGVRTDVVLPWEDGEVCVEGATFRYITTAGHCAEHLCYITPDNVAYLGDAILSPKLIQAIRLPYCVCLEAYMEALEKIAELNCDQYIFAHNGVETDIRQAVQITKDTLKNRLDRLELLAETPVTLDELVKKFLVQTKADLTSWRSVNGVGFNAKAFAGYLVDSDRLKFILEDGIMKYVRVDKNEQKTHTPEKEISKYT